MASPSRSKKVDPKHEAYKSRGMKSDKFHYQSYELPDMSEGNDGSKSAKYPPESKKKEPGNSSY